MMYSKISLKNDINIHIVTYKNLYANSYLSSDIWSWQDWLNKLKNPMIHEDKYKRGLVLYGDVENEKKDGRTVQKYRKDDNIINRSVITLDYDDINDSKGLYNAIGNQLESYSWAFHTTYSHTTDKPRIRLMIPINAPVSADNYRKYSRAVANCIGYNVDEASFVPSQVMALPVKPNQDTPFLFKYNDAPSLHIDQIKTWIKNVGNESDKQNSKASTTKKRDPSYWQSIAMGVGTGERNVVLTQVIGYLLRRYVDPSLVYGLAYGWAKQCNPPIEDKEITQTFKSIYLKHIRKG